MNYEQKYKEALERAKEWMAGKYSHYVSDTPQEIAEFIFPELKESEDEQIRKELIDFVKSRLAGFPQCEKYIAWLEKQGEQSPVDKVEPKFKVGKWYQCTKDFFGKGVTFDKNTAYYCAKEGCLQDEYGCHIAIVKDLYDNFKLWTIEDAKDGDVLACKEEILLFKSYSVQGRISLYCWYNGHTDNLHSKEVVDALFTTINMVCPATKEQRDLLFRKMKEAGYEWDAETKELKKAEQTIEIPFGAKDSELQESTYYIPEGYHAEINGNEVVIKKGEQKTTWKPTEEQIEALEHLLETIRRHEYSYFHEEKFMSLHSLLEQLKEL